MKKAFLLVPLLALALLSACADQSAGGTWEETDCTSFDLIQAAAISEETGVDVTKLRFDIDADPVFEYMPQAWLDDDTLLCTKRDKENAGEVSLVSLTLDGEEAVLEDSLDSFVIAQAQGGSVVYAHYTEMVLDRGITFAVWDGENRTLTPVDQFEDGYALGFQQFFSPDGSRAAFVWSSETYPEEDYHIRLVDMKTGETQDLKPPQWDTDAEATILICHWIDNQTLSVTETVDLLDGSDCIAWTYTF